MCSGWNHPFLLSWSILNYSATREEHHDSSTIPKTSKIGLLMKFFWKFFIVTSRIMVLSLFATVYKIEMFVFMVLHGILMVIWTLFMVRKMLFLTLRDLGSIFFFTIGYYNIFTIKIFSENWFWRKDVSLSFIPSAIAIRPWHRIRINFCRSLC